MNKSAKRSLFVLPIKQGKLFFKFVKFCQFFNINLFILVSKNGLWAPSVFFYFWYLMFLFICFVLIGKQKKISLTSCFCVRLVLCILMQKTANLWVVPVLRALFFGTPNMSSIKGEFETSFYFSFQVRDSELQLSSSCSRREKKS